MAKAIPGGLYTGDTVTYQYDNDGALAKTVDSETGVETAWYYDTTGRLTKHTEKGSGREYSISYEYDDKNNVTKTVEKANGNTVTQTYDYDMDNRPTAVHVTKVVGMDTQIHHILYFYDTLGRLQEQRIVNDDSYHGPIGTNWGAVQYAYTYVGAEGSTAPQISNVVMSGPNMQEQFTYTYDSTGNIATAYEGLSPYSGTVTYGYDALNEVVSEQNGTAGIDWTYYYDNSGNITHVIGRDIDDFRTQVESNTYTYGNSEWGDLLTAYNGTAITYDQIGNRLTDGTWTYTWEHGRELASMSNGATTWSYTYDANGLRTRRTNGTATYDYIYDGSGKLVCMDCGSYELYFTYDPVSGAPLTVTYTDSVDSTTYYYITNFRGDVCGIATDYGGVIAMYEYNAWGELVYMDDYTALGIASINPLRYRGYVYDRETGLYYLQSRYYDPEIGRFINADAFAATGQGLTGNNMFTYCGNNPVVRTDPSGESFAIVFGFNFNLFGWGMIGTINLVSTEENFGVQYSYYISGDPEISEKSNQTIGEDVGPYVGVQYTDKKSMEELEGYAKATGGDLMLGMDVLTEEDGDYLGWQFGSSVISANVHSLYTNTETLFSVPTLDLVEIIVDWIFGEK